MDDSTKVLHGCLLEIMRSTQLFRDATGYAEPGSLLLQAARDLHRAASHDTYEYMQGPLRSAHILHSTCRPPLRLMHIQMEEKTWIISLGSGRLARYS